MYRAAFAKPSTTPPGVERRTLHAPYECLPRGEGLQPTPRGVGRLEGHDLRHAFFYAMPSTNPRGGDRLEGHERGASHVLRQPDSLSLCNTSPPPPPSITSSDYRSWNQNAPPHPSLSPDRIFRRLGGGPIGSSPPLSHTLPPHRLPHRLTQPRSQVAVRDSPPNSLSDQQQGPDRLHKTVGQLAVVERRIPLRAVARHGRTPAAEGARRRPAIITADHRARLLNSKSSVGLRGRRRSQRRGAFAAVAAAVCPPLVARDPRHPPPPPPISPQVTSARTRRRRPQGHHRVYALGAESWRLRRGRLRPRSRRSSRTQRR